MSWKNITIIVLLAVIMIIGMENYKFEPDSPTSIYPPSLDFKSAVNASVDELFPEKTVNLLWDNYFYYFSWLESINVAESVAQANDSGGSTESNVTVTLFGSWGTAFAGSGTLANFNTSGAVLSTGATNSSQSAIYKRPVSQSIIRLDKKQRFRTAFRLSSVTNQVGYLVRGGAAVAGGDSKYYGFRINGNALQGTVENNNGSTRTNLNLGVTLSTNTTYEVEARLFPNDKVVFLVKNNSTGLFEEKGVIATYGAAGIPTGTTQNDFFVFLIGNTAAEDKQMTVSYVEYIQQR